MIKDLINCNIKHFSTKQLLLVALIVYSLAFSLSAFGKDYKMTKDEFLSRVSGGTVTLEKTPSLAMAPELVSRVIDAMKKEFPGFKDEMFYIAYVKSTDFTYFLFYEFYDRGCIFGITEPKKYKNNSDEKNGSLAMDEYKSYQKVDKKYCEKALGISLPDGSLSKIPNAIKPVKPDGRKK